jgi:hypothetical protein
MKFLMRSNLTLAIAATAFLALSLSGPSFAKPAAAEDTTIKDFRAPNNATILIIRHAEKPTQGFELSPAGQQRAVAYVGYFKNFTVDSKPLSLDAIYATADSKQSHRPRLTVEPLAAALKLKLRDQFKDRDVDKLAADIASKQHEKQILVCWHHGEIPALLRSLGADPATLLPNGLWPTDQFGWVLQLRYDHDGKLIPGETVRIDENLKLSP